MRTYKQNCLNDSNGSNRPCAVESLEDISYSKVIQGSLFPSRLTNKRLPKRLQFIVTICINVLTRLTNPTDLKFKFTAAHAH